MNQKISDIALISFRKLSLIQSNRSSKLNEIEYLFNFTFKDNINANDCQHDHDEANFSWIASMTTTSRSITSSSIFTKKRFSRNITLSFIEFILWNLYRSQSQFTTFRSFINHESYFNTIDSSISIISAQQTLALLFRNQTSVFTKSNSLSLSKIVTISNMLCVAHSVLSSRSSLCVQTRFDRIENPASRNYNAFSIFFSFVFIDESQSHFSAIFTSTGLNSTMPQLAFNKIAVDASTSQNSGQRQCQMMIFKTKQGFISMPLDVQSAFKVVDEKRKRNVTVSVCFRQRRKKNEQNKISNLKAQVRTLIEKNEQYRRKRDFLQGIDLQNHAVISPQLLSWRQKKHALFDEQQISDNQLSAQDRGRNTRRRTDAYVSSELSSFTVVAHVPSWAHDIDAVTRDVTKGAISSFHRAISGNSMQCKP